MSEEPQYIRLLQRQIKRYFTSQEKIPEDLIPFIDAVDNAYRHYEINRDILEQSMDLSTNELEQSNIKLRENNEILDDFNHSISHDLKNHSANITGLVKVLGKYLEKGDLEKVRLIVSKIELTGEQLHNVINGILEVAKSEKELGKVKSNIGLELFIDELKEEVLSIEKFNHAKIELKLNDVEEIFFVKEQLRSILRNFLSNSIKYSKPEVTPIIKITFNQLEENDCEIQIEDNGIGIDLNKDMNRLFKMFVRIENNLNAEGTGIGLFLTKKLIEKNGGELKVESELNVGTIFKMKFKNIIVK
ncbi:MAG: HAMP domain-containing histidine kinase [Flavobacteriales bacterium]|nr:HAMP domain-containing histidine kinase [Flavobacteriales bacterium]